MPLHEYNIPDVTLQGSVGLRTATGGASSIEVALSCTRASFQTARIQTSPSNFDDVDEGACYVDTFPEIVGDPEV